ncbi:YigZ family protein [Oleiagrimonas sp. MCCC 1A03011]|uniref:IMPACT family protein n=1 Tax=Oleiagrimonas sp. MCCC 1A03011 TaxID=1926883 RepID=UPI000DC456F4|nr:YigZ family protein [Oleiagrimonas sp. MCCC 1A03011]RAP57779.1 thymidylate synthase [Oleiagrimonas sp. MCCC 1A03011]
MSDTFTLTSEHRHEDEIRKSRFLAQVAPISDVKSAIAFIERVSDATANHNCWAYRIGQDYRFSDDGEPGGSAGKPILQAIEGQELDGVVAVVTRWFGGIKLGVGGLIRAYGGTAAECLRQASRTPIVDTTQVEFELGYAELPLFKARVQDWHLGIEHEDFGPERVTVTAQVATRHLDALQVLLADLSRGQSRVRHLDERNRDTP